MIFLAGGAVGAVAALMFAPKTGQECRKQLLQYGRRTGETLSGWVGDVYATLANKEEEAKPTVQETDAGTPGDTTWRHKAISS
jgi:gas vesicle protein